MIHDTQTAKQATFRSRQHESNAEDKLWQKRQSFNLSLNKLTLRFKTIAVFTSFNLMPTQGRVKHLVGPTHFTMPGPQRLCW